MIATLLSLFLTSSLAAPLQAKPLAPLDRKAIEAQVDVSLRWLRAQQDADSGSYGSVLETARVLHTLAVSHRAYRPSDGPFVSSGLPFLERSQRADGAITSGDASLPIAWLETWWALRAADALGANTDEWGEAARAFLERHEGWKAPLEAKLELDDSSEAPETRRARLGIAAARILGARSPEGFWSGADGAESLVLQTCRALTQLGGIRTALKTLEPKAPTRTARPLPAFDAADRERATAALARGREFLLEAADAPGRWGFGGQADPGITAMVAGALLNAPPSEARDAALDSALDWLVSLQKEDGSIHAGQLANYVTSASLMALARAGRVGDAPVIARGRDYLKVLQSDEGEGYGSSDRFYGGVGYGGDERPDLSNLQMALEALNASGVGPEDATFQRALKFLQRCQNRSESNDLEISTDGDTIVSGNDGGSGYAPGDSKAGFVELRDGRKIPRSYGSMTYALLKGYLFAGLPRDDPRVQAAWEWLSRNYTLDVNPGFEASSDPVAAYQGLFYYFTTMAKALDLYGSETITDAAGREHAWRAELLGRLTAMQRQDGSWINTNAPRWYEGNPVLATAYAMSAIGTALGE